MAQSNNIPSRLTPQSANWPDSLPHPVSGDIGISITKCGNYGLVNLRCAPQDSGLIENLFGCRAPSQPNQFSSAGQRLAVWLGPDETLLMLDDRDEAEFTRAAGTHMGKRLFALTTVTDGFAIFRIEGTEARTMLSKGISVDLHPQAFRTGMCFQSLLSHVAITCLCLADNSFMLICRTSFSDYLESWMKDAATEYGYRLVR